MLLYCTGKLTDWSGRPRRKRFWPISNFARPLHFHGLLKKKQAVNWISSQMHGNGALIVFPLLPTACQQGLSIKRHVLLRKLSLILKRVHWEDDWVMTMSTSLSRQLLSSLVVRYVALLLRTKMWGPTLVSSSVIFAKSTFVSRASGPFIQIHLWKTWSSSSILPQREGNLKKRKLERY